MEIKHDSSGASRSAIDMCAGTGRGAIDSQFENATELLSNLARADDNKVPMFKLEWLMKTVVKAAGGGGDVD